MSQIASRAAVLMATPLPADTLSMRSSPAISSASFVDAASSSEPDPAVVADHADPAGGDVAVAGEATTPVFAAAAPGAAPATGVATFTLPAATTASTVQAGTPPAIGTPPSTTDGIGGAVTALIIVIGLILALAWLAKRMPVLGGGTGGSPALRIVGSLALGPRERVVVVAVGDTQLLLGVGAGGTRTLHTLSAPLPITAASTPAFAQVLAQHFGKKA